MDDEAKREKTNSEGGRASERRKGDERRLERGWKEDGAAALVLWESNRWRTTGRPAGWQQDSDLFWMCCKGQIRPSTCNKHDEQQLFYIKTEYD